MRDYFIEARQKAGVINFDPLGMWSKIQSRIDLWLEEACIWKHLNPNQVPRVRDTIWHRLKDRLAKTIRETLGAGAEQRRGDEENSRNLARSNDGKATVALEKIPFPARS
jgi:hypothetical protein